MSSDDQNAFSVPDAECARETIEILVRAFIDLTSAGQVVVPRTTSRC